MHFIGKLEKGDANTVFTLFGERWELVKADAVGLAAARDALPGEANRVSVDGWVCRAVDGDATRHHPVGVRDGLLMVWPGTCKPDEELPGTFKPPEGYTVHAELIIEDVPVEHGLLMENCSTWAHAPFTHTGTFAKGWGCPTFVEFVTKQMPEARGRVARHGERAGDEQRDPGPAGELEPLPHRHEICDAVHGGLAHRHVQAGAAGGGAQFEEGVACAECSNHLHQLHVCLPSEPGRTRLLYRMSLDFAGWAKFVPGIELVWTEMANQVLGEDLRLVTGQQDRMQRGGGCGRTPWRTISSGSSIADGGTSLSANSASSEGRRREGTAAPIFSIGSVGPRSTGA